MLLSIIDLEIKLLMLVIFLVGNLGVGKIRFVKKLVEIINVFVYDFKILKIINISYDIYVEKNIKKLDFII